MANLICSTERGVENHVASDPFSEVDHGVVRNISYHSKRYLLNAIKDIVGVIYVIDSKSVGVGFICGCH